MPEIAPYLNVKPNWSSEVSEKLTFRTKIFASQDLTEFRESAYVEPRRTVSFSGGMSATEASAFRADLETRPGLKWTVSSPIHTVKLRSAYTAGNNSLDLEHSVPWADFGSYVVVESLASVWIFQVQWVNLDTDKIGVELVALFNSGSGVDLNPDPLMTEGGNNITTEHGDRLVANKEGAAIPAGASCAAMLSGYVDVSMGHPTSAYVTYDFSIEATAGDTNIVFREGFYDPARYDGAPFFKWNPNWASAGSTNFGASVVRRDYGSGFFDQYQLSTNPITTWSGEYLGRDRLDVWEVENFFCQMRGQQKQFYAPMHSIGFNAVGPASGTSSTLAVRGTGYQRLYDLHPSHNHITYKGVSGGVEVRRVTSVNTSGGFSILTLDRPLGVELFGGSEKRVYMVSTARMGEDSMEVSWVTKDVANFGLSFRMLEDRIIAEIDYLLPEDGSGLILTEANEEIWVTT